MSKMGTTMTMGPKGQIVIPAAVRRAVDLQPGQRVDIEVRNGVVVLTPIPNDLIKYLAGKYKGTPSPLKDLIAEHAEEVRRDEEGRL
ncbi:MAG: AbrB/MazE/SpoVT family DNA-binding domain-containing protein [Armatimonadetes bacterium]|nr:AbrB/MazE/SpoVT family DNA-binding domain-containing protein [Armatimonadota bacterium]